MGLCPSPKWSANPKKKKKRKHPREVMFCLLSTVPNFQNNSFHFSLFLACPLYCWIASIIMDTCVLFLKRWDSLYLISWWVTFLLLISCYFSDRLAIACCICSNFHESTGKPKVWFIKFVHIVSCANQEIIYSLLMLLLWRKI